MKGDQHSTYKSILLSTFYELVNFLESHNLNWFVGFGTLIGTIRHGGLIPWDDDIDILMPREDYNKLIDIYKLEDSDYYIKSIDDEDYPFAFGKFCYKHSTIVETKTTPCVFGIYVDIFPLDDIGLDYLELAKVKTRYELLHRNYERSLNKYTGQYVLSLISGFRVLNFIAFIKDIFWYSHLSRYYLKEMKKIESITKIDSSPYNVVLAGLYGERDIYKKEWFSDFVYMQFETFSVRVPIGYDECLKRIYGDYMTLPPENERHPKHCHIYENISEGMSYARARQYYDNRISSSNE